MSAETLFEHTVAPSPPQVSVVMPVYNGAKWIGEALESVCGQAECESPFEIIVVDDGSDDGSAELAGRMLITRPQDSRVLRLSNGGPSRARNIGWRSARAPWIQFLDSDDLLHPHKLRHQCTLAVLAGRETAVIYSDWSRLEEREGYWQEELPRCAPRVSNNTLESLIRAEHFIQLGSTLIQRCWLENVGGFDEVQWVIEDVNLLIRIALAGGAFVHAPSEFPVLYYRRRQRSLSSRTEEFARGCYGNAKLVEEHWRSTRSLNPQRRVLLGQIYLFAANLVAPHSAATCRAMLRGLTKLALPAAPCSRAGRRLLLRAMTYRCFGHAMARACERTYLRLTGAIGLAFRSHRKSRRRPKHSRARTSSA